MTQRFSEGTTNTRDCIDLQDPSELETWAQALSVTVPELISAISAVGDRASRVQSYLQALR